jgi:hypothetical protein
VALSTGGTAVALQAPVRYGLTSAVIVLGVLVAGCASGTRMIQFGRLPNSQPLVTLVVSDDREVVERECRGDGPRLFTVLGCQRSWPVFVGEGRGVVRAVKIVRYTDALPSELAFEIDAHELCHAVAALQTMEDPCHADNAGLVQAAGSGPPLTLARRR